MFLRRSVGWVVGRDIGNKLRNVVMNGKCVGLKCFSIVGRNEETLALLLLVVGSRDSLIKFRSVGRFRLVLGRPPPLKLIFFRAFRNKFEN